MISAIVSVDNNWAIGADNNLVVRNPMDLLWFKGFTYGKTLLCGYNTYQSLPELKGRNVVLDDRHEESIHLIRHNNLVVIGGAKTYQKYAYLVGELFITINDTEAEKADCYFPHRHYEHLSTHELIHKGEWQGVKYRIERWIA